MPVVVCQDVEGMSQTSTMFSDRTQRYAKTILGARRCAGYTIWVSTITRAMWPTLKRSTALTWMTRLRRIKDVCGVMTMADPAYFRRTATGYAPHSVKAQAWFDKDKPGDLREFKTSKPRDIVRHRKYFALLNLTFENQDKFDSIEHLRAWVQIKAGHVELIEGVYLPKSIAFSEMDEVEFLELYNGVINVILREVIPGMDRGDLEREIIAF